MIRLYNQNIWGNMFRGAQIANRNALIAEIIGDYRPDFCCFQECNPSTSRAGESDISALLAADYAEACVSHAHENFTPVFYLKERFEELDGGFMPYEGLNDKRSKSVTWALFRDKKEGHCFIFASTHFWWMYEGDADNQQREQNAVDLAALLDDVLARYDVPVVVSGDLNCGYVSKQGPRGYQKMRELGFVDVRDIAQKSTKSHTIHEYAILAEEGIYTPGGETYATIDYIFTYGKSLRVTNFEVLDDDRARTTSDHCPLIADFDM